MEQKDREAVAHCLSYLEGMLLRQPENSCESIQASLKTALEWVKQETFKSKPIDPSPTPWDFSTWGFYCDTCDKFFNLLDDGKVVMDEKITTHSYEHNCGNPARYIGYDHSKQNSCNKA